MAERQASFITHKDIDDMVCGDAALMHLLAQIDNGIRQRRNQKLTKRALMFRQWYRIFEPFKYFILIWYIMLTQFERPAWCIRLYH